MTVNFLGLTLTICGKSIKSKTFQKIMNLYLYLLQTSNHLLSCIKGILHSLIGCYYVQNNHCKDNVTIVGLLYKWLSNEDGAKA